MDIEFCIEDADQHELGFQVCFVLLFLLFLIRKSFHSIVSREKWNRREGKKGIFETIEWPRKVIVLGDVVIS